MKVASTLIPPFYNIVINTINIYYIRFPLSQQQFHALNLRHDMTTLDHLHHHRLDYPLVVIIQNHLQLYQFHLK